MSPKRPRAYNLPSLIYFIYFGTMAAYIPFLALYYQDLGLPGGEIGLLMSISPLVSLFANPLWTGMADATHRHKAVLTVTLLASVVILVIFPTVKKPGLLFVVISLFAFFSAPIGSLVDSATLFMLGDKREKYGRVRFWGTVGWGLVAPLVGGVLQRFGLAWAFWIYAIGLLLVILPARQLIFNHVSSSISFLQGLRELLANRRWILFLAMTFIAGIGLSVANNYLSVLMESLGGSRTLTGIALLVTTISELPVLFFSNRLLRLLKTRGLFILAMAVIGIRCLLYTVIRSPGGLIAAQLLHGLTYAALWVAGVTYASESAPASLSATAQGLFGSMLMGIGSAAGNLLGGILIERVNPSGMYGVIGGIVLVGLGVCLLIEKHIVRESPTKAAPDIS